MSEYCKEHHWVNCKTCKDIPVIELGEKVVEEFLDGDTGMSAQELLGSMTDPNLLHSIYEAEEIYNLLKEKGYTDTQAMVGAVSSIPDAPKEEIMVLTTEEISNQLNDATRHSTDIAKRRWVRYKAFHDAYDELIEVMTNGSPVLPDSYIEKRKQEIIKASKGE